MLAIFNGKATFDTPKPRRLLEFVLTVAGNQNTLILDSFAGSGTTAHAVLNMNKADGGSRKFILVEMMDYADSITAERVKRVIQGYGEGKNAVEGTGGSFSFYDLGQPLLIGENLNEEVAPEKIREYIWFMETKAPYAPPAGENARTACQAPHRANIGRTAAKGVLRRKGSGTGGPGGGLHAVLHHIADHVDLGDLVGVAQLQPPDAAVC